jgi:hypothetical protein
VNKICIVIFLIVIIITIAIIIIIIRTLPIASARKSIYIYKKSCSNSRPILNTEKKANNTLTL